MATSVMQVRVDDELKAQAAAIFLRIHPEFRCSGVA